MGPKGLFIPRVTPFSMSSGRATPSSMSFTASLISMANTSISETLSVGAVTGMAARPEDQS